MNRLTPPRWARWLLTLLHPDDTLEEVEGDLDELYTYWYVRKGKTQATLRYLLNVLSVLPPFVQKRERKQDEYQPLSNLHPDMIRNYLTIAWRNLLKNKAYSAINIIGLSIGIAAAMLIMLYLTDEVSYDQFHANNPHIYRIVYSSFGPSGSLEEQQGNSGYLQGPKFTAGVPEIQSFVRYKRQQVDLKQGGQVNTQTIFQADPTFFSLFSFPLVSGNPAMALQQPRSVVLSEAMARQQFGTTQALGKLILMKEASAQNGQFEPYTVTGIAKNCPQNSSIKFDVLVPLVVEKQVMENRQEWFSTFLNTFVVIRPDANPKAVERTINRLYLADAKEVIEGMAKKYDYHNTRQYALQPFTEMHLSKELPANNGLMDRSSSLFSYILSGIALFILLGACINFVNLTVARSLKRAKEIGVRKVNGGGRRQLMIQFLSESFGLCLVAFLVGLLLVQIALPTFNQLANKTLSVSYLFDFRLVAGYILLLVATGLLAGFYPALVLSGYNPVQTLYNRFALSGKNYLQKALVVLQFSIASILIIGTLTIYSQFNYLITKNLGYNDKHVISIEKGNLTRREAQLLKQELLQNPAILAVAPKNRGRQGTGARINGGTEIDFTYETVDGAYLPLFGIPIRQGRNFSAAFPSDSTKSVLVNETFVRRAGWKKPLGQVVDFWYEDSAKYQVIGVVKDYHYTALNQEIGPQVFTMKPGSRLGKVFIKIKPTTETVSLNYIEKTFKKLFPIHPYNYTFLDEENRNNYESEAKWRQIMLFGAILTIFISCIGLFGLAALSAERRIKEIGIRKVMGASVSGIVGLLSADFIKLVSFSFVVAFPLAYYITDKWLHNYPYRIDMSAWTFVSAASLTILVALCAVSFQSIRAALSNPVKSLRSE